MPWQSFLSRPPAELVFWFVIAVLATWRLTLILHQEKIAKPIRDLIGIREVPILNNEIVRTYPDTFIGQLFSCFMCLSVWVSFGVMGLLLFLPIVLIPLALSMAAIALQISIFER